MYNYHIIFKPSFLKLFYNLGLNALFISVVYNISLNIYLRWLILCFIIFNIIIDLQSSKFFNFSFPLFLIGESILSLEVKLKQNEYFLTTNNRIYEKAELIKLKPIIANLLVYLELKTDDNKKHKYYIWQDEISAKSWEVIQILIKF